MDDLIVVILTLVVAGFGLLGQLKKKKQVPAGNDAPKAPESFWDLIQGNTENQNQFGEPEFEDLELEHQQTTVENRVETNMEKSIYRDLENSEKITVLKNNEMLDSIKPKSKSKIRKEFSLRKAVIYSEILNRKYT